MDSFITVVYVWRSRAAAVEQSFLPHLSLAVAAEGFDAPPQLGPS